MKNNHFLLFLTFIFFISLLGYLIVYKFKITTKPIRADAEGYYAYLPAMLIYKDPGMILTSIYQPDALSFSSPPIYQNLNTNRNIDKYPLGVAILLLPFFIIAHFLSFIISSPLDGYAPLYQYIVGSAGIFYLLIGLYYLKKLYQHFFNFKTIIITLTLLLFATNLYHYATFDSLMSHVFTFTLLSVFLYKLINWSKQPTLKNSLVLGGIWGLLILIRNTNIIFGLLLLPCFKKHLKYSLLIMLTALLISLPQLIYWRYVSGSFIIFSYKGESFNFLNPNFYGVLLSPRKGLFFWTPIWLLGFWGIKTLSKKIKPLFLSLIAIVILSVWINASWYDWAMGASFGNRTLIDIYPILGLFLATLVETIWTNPKIRKPTIIFFLLLILINLTNMIKYWQRILPYDQVTLKLYINNLFKIIK